MVVGPEQQAVVEPEPVGLKPEPVGPERAVAGLEQQAVLEPGPELEQQLVLEPELVPELVPEPGRMNAPVQTLADAQAESSVRVQKTR